MKLQKLHIKNFKSIVDLEIVEPNPFTVFVGPNGSGKSNIFEALEFWSYYQRAYPAQIISLFGGKENIKNFNLQKANICSIELEIENFKDTNINFHISDEDDYSVSGGHMSFPVTSIEDSNYKLTSSYHLFKSFSRLFINNKKLQKLNLNDFIKLSLSTDNLEKVLKRILQDEVKREEIKEWLDLFIPGFENLEIVSSELSGTDTLVMYDKSFKKPFTKDLLSDGTYNILALLTAVYQSDEPQFLCIEEPENGLNPYVIRKLVDFFRAACEEKGHYIWLNTHSNALVECLTPEEVIVVDKIGGETKIKQIKGMDLHGLNMAEVWLSGALGGGTPW